MNSLSHNNNDDGEIRLLLMGQRNSGKSSINKVVFHKMAPTDTQDLQSTNQILKDDVKSTSFINLQIWDCPGQLDFTDPNTYDLEQIFNRKGAIIFVIDAQADYTEALFYLNKVFTTAFGYNPDLKFEVFIHKMDGVAEDLKLDLQRDIHQRAADDLIEAGLQDIHLSFNLTSIYDHSIYEALSKVVQKLIKPLDSIEKLLNIFISNSSITKVFLFDMLSKIYIATDNSQVDMDTFELCCDMIDLILDISSVYCDYGEDGDDIMSRDMESGTLVRLNNETLLYMRQVDKYLALISIISENNFKHRGTIDFNFEVLRKGLRDVLRLQQNNQLNITNNT